VRIAVTGAAGRLGGQVAGILATAGEHQVVAVSRRPLAGAGPGPRGEVAAADYAGRRLPARPVGLTTGLRQRSAR
jgi:NAD(P)H dehydrogenase (quinone)